jgi:hypothetical protein
MAETVDINAIARVVDLASPVIKAITGAITGMGSAASAASSAVAGMSGKMAGTVGNMVRGLGRAGGEVEGFGKKIAGMFGPLQGLAGVASLTGITAAVISFVNQSRKLDEMSRSLKVSADMLEAFETAAGGPEHADAALKHLHDTMASVTAGGKDAEQVVNLMHKFGVTAKEISDGNLDEILPKIAAGFAANTDPALRSRMALALFGDEGERLIPFLAKGPAGVRELAAEMKRLGLASHLPEALAAGKALDALSASVTQAKNAIAAAVLPAFVPMVQAITDFVNANQELLKQVALPAFIGLIASSLVSLGIALAGALGPWGLLVAAIVAGAAAIYMNWDKVKAFFDETLPGFLPALEETGAGILSWAKKASADLTAGFQTGGISGGLNAIWTTFKNLAEDTFAWVVNTFNAINWGDVGNKAASLLWAGMKALFNAEVSLGQIILDKLNAIQWSDLGRTIINGIISGFEALLSADTSILATLRGLDWSKAGEFAGKAIVAALVGAFDAVVWVANLIAGMLDAVVGADWGKITTQIAKYFIDLGATLLSIGFDLITGLLKGMWNAIPGIDAIADKIKNSIRDAAKAAGAWFTGGGGEEGTPGLPPPPARLNPGAAPGGTPRAEVNAQTDIHLHGLPAGASATATSTTNGRPGGVNIGPNGVGAGAPG